MKRIYTVMAAMLLLVLTVKSQAPDVFSHPGIFSGQIELDALKGAVAADNGNPLVAGYEVLANGSFGSLDYTPTPYANVHVVASGIGDEERAFRQDAHSLYIHAIKWVVTGDNAHRDKAIEIADAWSSVFETLVAEVEKPNQPTLEASWALPIWLAGAEILKYHDNNVSGWDSNDFESFVSKILIYVNGPIYQTANWLISKDLSLMCAGVFLNDIDIYNQGYNHVTGQINQINATTGDIPELTRDFVHSQYVLIGMTQCAEIAFQQGDAGLFTMSDARLRTGAESYVLHVMGINPPNYLSSSGWARKSAPYEILLKRYTELELPVPNVQYYVISQNRAEDGSEDHFIGYHTATHAIIAEAGEAPVNNTAVDVPGNLAFEKSAVTSSEPQPENPAKAANDNNTTTRWSSKVFPQWLEIDLGEVMTIGKTEVICFEDRAYRFTIEARANETDEFQLLIDRRNNITPGAVDAPITDAFQQLEARYIRLTVTGAAVYTGEWASITEFRIFEDGGYVTQVPLLSGGNKMGIYPNPSSHQISVNGASSDLDMVLIDWSGRIVMDRRWLKGESLDISALQPGVYCIQTTSITTRQLQTLKFVKL